MSEYNNEFQYKILTTEAKISILYQLLTELEQSLYQQSFDEPIVEDLFGVVALCHSSL